MSEKYEEKLWGKIDFLHEKALREHANLNIFSDIITKFQHCLLDFSKYIDNIKNKNAKIIDEKGSTVDLIVTNFKQVLKSHVSEFKECGEHMKSTIVGAIIQTNDEKFSSEKDMYYQYNKIKNIYNNSKINLEKARKEFENSAKLCEKNIYNLVQLKTYSFENSEDITKTEERVNISIANTKNLEDKYYRLLKEANKARENEIKKQNELLKYYQIMHTDFYIKINCVISYFIPMVKKMYASIVLALDALDSRCKQINIGKDINDFIEKNKTDLKPDEPIKFVPYYPTADITNKNITGNDKKDLDNLDINFNVISTLHKHLRDIRKDLNMAEEKKKYRLRFLCTKIFKIGPGMSFKKEEKSELISLLKEKFYKSYFLITLSKQRTRGRFQRSETLLNDLSEILHYILDESEILKDYESSKNCIILSQTFYFEKQNKKNKNEKKKVYLFEYIKYYKWLKSLDFWEGIIDYMIKSEITKTEEINKKNKVNETQEDLKNRLSNIAFSQVLSYTNSMIEFEINKDDIIKIVDVFSKKYEITPAMSEAIYENIKNSKQAEVDEELRNYFMDLEEKYEKKRDEEKNNSFDNNIANELRDRSQTIQTNMKADDLKTNDVRSKSLKEKNNPYKGIMKIDKSGKNKIEEEPKKEDNKTIEDSKEKDENKIIEEKKEQEQVEKNNENKIIDKESKENKDMENKIEGNQIEESKTEEKKNEENKNEENKIEENKIEENTNEEKKIEEIQVEEKKIEESKADENKIEENKNGENNIEENKNIENNEENKKIE